MVKPETIASEGPREWETLKYVCCFTTTKPAGDSTCPCSDTVLTGLTQLAAFRLHARRAIISFFDRKHEYIVAEATQSSPLYPSPNGIKDQLWPSGIVPRAESICEHVLLSRGMDLGHEGLKVSVIPDLAQDAQSRRGSDVEQPPQHRFYCGTPIQTPKGFNIGVLSVFDDNPRPDGLDKDSAQFLRDLSRTVMSYLETRRATDNFIRSERMVNGLSHLIRGNDNPTDGISKSRRNASRNASRTRRFQQNDSSKPVVKSISIPHATTSESMNGTSEPKSALASPTATNLQAEASPFVDPQKVQFATMLSKAADIVCDSLKVDGAIFLDAASSLLDVDHKSHAVNDSASSSDDSSADHVSNSQSRRPCTILALSTTDQAILDLAQPGSDLSLNQKTLRRLISRYPNGKIFSFEESGSLYSGESSSGEEADPRLSDIRVSRGVADSKAGPSRKDEAKPIAELFSGARSVALVPLWDPSRDRFYACGFVWSKTAARILTTEADLPYLRALGIVTMAEINRIDITLANKAKADLLGTLSHELRSPLHGILAAAELLADMPLDPFQEEVVHAMGISGKTLLETIDHLLVFSKVNTLSRAFKAQKEHRSHHGLFKDDHDQEKSWIANLPEIQALFTDVSMDRLAEEVIESVTIGHSFHYTTTPQGPRWAWPDAAVGKVQITVDIDHRKPWIFRTEPGGIRRIIMNILGNALKYTEQGHIKISLKQEKGASHKGSRKWANVVLTVSDTGKGISDDFLRNKLFVPFSQEDSLAIGTGLGLSIVKQIVTSMGGSIGVRSHVGKGTTVSVSMPIARASTSITKEEQFGFDTSPLDGVRVKAVGFSRSPCAAAEVDSQADLPLESLPLKWFNMELCEDGAEESPGMIIYSEAAYGKLDEDAIKNHALPAVVICYNAGTGVKLDSVLRESDSTAVFEFIHQPNTPRKFGKTLAYALNRWKDLQQAPLDIKEVSNPTHNAPRHARSMSNPDRERPLNGAFQEQPDERSSFIQLRDYKPKPVQSILRLNSSEQIVDHTPRSNGDMTVNPVIEIEPPQTRSKFLLVDDNSINLKLLSAYMKKLRRPYCTAVNGLEALTTFQQNAESFCCVLMDINMPVMDGLESTRLIRKFERENHLKPVTIIAITGLASGSARDEAFASGLDVFLTRPVSMGQLFPVLKERGLGEPELVS
ncbi:hypothetical protein ACJZ2D_008701 [Fusarium nematophilum]